MGLYDQLKALEAEDEEVTEGQEEAAGAGDNDEAKAAGDDNEAGDSPDAAGDGEADAEGTGGEHRPAAKAEQPVKAPVAAQPPAEKPKQTPAENADFARMRRQLEQHRQQQAAKGQPQAQPKAENKPDPEPDKATNYEGWLEWNLRQERAAREQMAAQLGEVSKKFETLEDRQQREVAEREDWDALMEMVETQSTAEPEVRQILNWGWQQVAMSIKVQNPGLSNKRLAEATNKYVLNIANQAAAAGVHPLQYLVGYTRQLGWRSEFAQQQAQQEQADDGGQEQPGQARKDNGQFAKPGKPDLKQIQANRKKSGSPLAGGGNSGPAPLSKEHFGSKNFGFKEFARLSPQELNRLESETPFGG